MFSCCQENMQINANQFCFGKYGTIKEGYQVYAVRGYLKLAFRDIFSSITSDSILFKPTYRFYKLDNRSCNFDAK